MRIVRQVALVLCLISLNPAFAQDTSCCDQLRKEVQVLKEQQDKIFKELKQEEMSEGKSFAVQQNLMEVLTKRFPELKEAFQKIKDVYEQLSKATNS